MGDGTISRYDHGSYSDAQIVYIYIYIYIYILAAFKNVIWQISCFFVVTLKLNQAQGLQQVVRNVVNTIASF